MTRLFPPCMALIAAFWASPTYCQNRQREIIDTVAIEADARRLADDSLSGRFTGSPGAALAARYIASRCAELGLAPAGGSYLHAVPITRIQATAQTSLRVADKAFRIPTDIQLDRAPALEAFGGRAVFVGPGAHDTRQSVALAGRVAVSVGLLSASSKDTMLAAGAVGLIQLVGRNRFADLQEQSGPFRHRLADSIPSSFHPALPSIIAVATVAEALLAGTPAATGDMRTPRDLYRSVEFTPVLEQTQIASDNVACLLEGTSLHTIVLGAHYDHLGVGRPDASGDSIYNGFADNAIGVAMVLAMAASLRDDPVDHRVLFLFLTGEELGLLGADAYVHAPLFPLAETTAAIVLDAGAPPAPPTSWELASTAPLDTIALAVASERGWQIRISAPRPNSDYYPFVRRGVQAMLIIPGQQPYEGLTADQSRVLFDRWDRYHVPGDEWRAGYPLSGVRRYAEFALQVVRGVDQRYR